MNSSGVSGIPVSAMRIVAAPMGDRPIILVLVANSNFLPYLSRMVWVHVEYRTSVSIIGKEREREGEREPKKLRRFPLQACTYARALLADRAHAHPQYIPIIVGTLG